MGTTKGYTGQYNDALTQLDYYGARYYDPLVGLFLSADSVQGNLAGMNPYSYVGSNPETNTDPTGNYFTNPTGPGPISPPVKPTNPSTDPNNPLNWPKYTPGGSQDPMTPDDLPWFFLSPPQFFIATLLALALVAATPQQLAPATVLIPYGTPFRSKSSEEVYGPLPTTTPPQTQPGEGGVPQALPGGGSGGSNRPPNRPPTAPPPDFPGSTDPKVRVSQKGLDTVRTHLSRPIFTDPSTGELGVESPENATMIQRLEEALNQGNTVSGPDANFYFHELYESTLMDRGLSYDEAHQQALSRYGVSEFALYHPDVIQAFPYLFNSAWLDFWGILP